MHHMFVIWTLLVLTCATILAFVIADCTVARRRRHRPKSVPAFTPPNNVARRTTGSPFCPGEMRDLRNQVTGPGHDDASFRCKPVLPHGEQTCYDTFWCAVKSGGEARCYGYRDILETKDVQVPGSQKPITKYKLSPYHWLSYAEVGARVTDLGSGLRSLGLGRGDMVGMYIETCLPALLTINASFSHSMIPTTVYANMGAEGIVNAFTQTKISVLLTSDDLLNNVLELLERLPLLKSVIAVGRTSPSMTEKFMTHGVRLLNFDELVEIGAKNPVAHDPPAPTDTAVVMFTSGTTGIPKGVVLLHTTIVGAVVSGQHAIKAGIHPEETYLSYLPIAHIFELFAQSVMMAGHVPIGFGRNRTLTDAAVYDCKADLSELRPTIFAGVPLIFEKIRKGVEAKIHSQSLLKKLFVLTALQLKQRMVGRIRYTLTARVVCAIIDRLVCNKFAQAMGGRLRMFVSGGALLSKKTHRWMLAAFCCDVVIGYGLTETVGILSVHHAHDCRLGRVGNPCCSCEIKLEDVPELNYTSKSKPYPAGEVCVRGNQVAVGYYNLPEDTAEAFTPDGYFHTGDIAQLYPDGAFELIDRKKNVVKLAHGEYLPLEKIETVYMRSSWVDFVWLFADTSRVLPVAICILSKSRAESFLGEKFKTDEEYAQATKNPRIIKAVEQSFQNAAEQSKLARFERPGAFALVADEWTPEAGLMSSTMKLKRPALAARYANLIQELYKGLPAN